MMRQHFDELKKKVEHTDERHTKELVETIKKAYEEGKIDEAEKRDLLQGAKGLLGSMDLGNIKDAGYFGDGEL